MSQLFQESHQQSHRLQNDDSPEVPCKTSRIERKAYLCARYSCEKSRHIGQKEHSDRD